MQKYGIAINDLHKLSTSFESSFFSKPGDVHFTKAGYEKLAAQVAAKIMEELTNSSEQDAALNGASRRE